MNYYKTETAKQPFSKGQKEHYMQFSNTVITAKKPMVQTSPLASTHSHPILQCVSKPSYTRIPLTVTANLTSPPPPQTFIMSLNLCYTAAGLSGKVIKPMKVETCQRRFVTKGEPRVEVLWPVLAFFLLANYKHSINSQPTPLPAYSTSGGHTSS